MNEYDIERAKAALLALKEKLPLIKRASIKSVNVFDAAGMGVQEIKHSAFFAWLLDPQKPHGLGSEILKQFCERLVAYVADDETVCRTNKEIIGNALDNMGDLLSDTQIEVTTEKVVVSKDSRIDIFIASKKAHTVIVIENKTFTSMHDDQLNRYEQELEIHSEYKNYNKVFVYLTPQGSSPEDDDWCTFDYSQVVSIIREVHKTLPKGKTYAKLKTLLEDYMELVETSILKRNKELRRLCNEISREHAYALKLLSEYSDNGKEVVAYIKKWLIENVGGVNIFRGGEISFDLYTDKIEQKFNERDNGLWNNDCCKCRVCVYAGDGPVVGLFALHKNADDEWSRGQLEIMNRIAPNKMRGYKYFRMNKFQLLSEDERELPFDSVKPMLDGRLAEFATKIKAFEEML